MSLVEKLCPVVLREFSGQRQLLVFEHPLAGVQLVKGTREPGEAVGHGALRELREESGISTASLSGSAWTSLAIAEGQLWHFVPVEAGPLPDRFAFDTLDDGGHSFRFFWWPLDTPPDARWHEIFVAAFEEIRQWAVQPERHAVQ